MNSRYLELELVVSEEQVKDAIQFVIHQVLFYRTTGKFMYTAETPIQVGTVGYTDVLCATVDAAYVKINCTTLDKQINKVIQSFLDGWKLEQNKSGKISIEFYEKKDAPWIFKNESIPWEIWNLNLVKAPVRQNEADREAWKIKVGVEMTELMKKMINFYSHCEYLPPTPAVTDVQNIYDTSFELIQPYLFNIKHSFDGEISSIFRKLSKG